MALLLYIFPHELCVPYVHSIYARSWFLEQINDVSALDVTHENRTLYRSCKTDEIYEKYSLKFSLMGEVQGWRCT